MSAVEIKDVVLLGEGVPGVLEYGLTSPHAGDSRVELGLEVRGWAIGSGPEVRTIELVCEDELVREIPIDIRGREDAADARPSRFFGVVGALRLPPRFTVIVRARFEDGGAAVLAEISGERESLADSGAPGNLRAGLISTPTGRTGTTWVVHLLGHHPQIVAYPPHGVEPRAASYWLEVLAALSEPGSYKRVLRTSVDRDHWWLGEWPEAGRQPIRDEWTQRYLGRDRTVALAKHAREQIEDFYRGVAGQQGKQRAEVFVEKAPMGRLRLEVLSDLLPETKDVTLFRDPRDTICSILSYADKNPNAALVSDRPDTGDEYLEIVADSFRGLLEEARARPDESLVVRYEDLLLEPEPTLGRILEHLDLDAGESSIAETLSSALESAEHLSGHRTASGSVNASIGRWRRDMDAGLQLRSSSIFADVLAELDYLDGEPAPAPATRKRRRDPVVGVSRGLLRTIDHRRWRHVYGVDAAPSTREGDSAVPVTELGALVADQGPGLIALRMGSDGRVGTGDHEPARPDAGLSQRLRWARAPIGWKEDAGFAVRARSSLGRLRRLLSQPWRTGSGAESAEALGYLHPKPGGGRRPLFSSVHPVTGDQLLTTRPKEAEDLGYPDPTRLGFIEAAAPVTGELAPKRGIVPWAHRFGTWRAPRGGGSQGAILEPVKGRVPRDALRVRGWAVLRNEPVARVDVQINGSPVGRARLGLQRPRAESMANPETVISGFDLRVPPSALPAGVREARISALVTGVRGTRIEFTAPEEIELTDPVTEVSEDGVRRVARANVPAADGADNGHVPTATSSIDAASVGSGSTSPDDGKAIRLVAFAHSLAPGGAQRTLFEQLYRLTKAERFTAAVVATERGLWAQRFEEIGVPVHVAGQLEGPGPEAYERAVAELSKVLEQEAPDAVLANTIDSFAGADAATRLGLPVAWIIHESYEFPVWWQMGHPDGPEPHARERCLEALFSAAATIFPANATRVLYEPYVRAERSLTAPCGVEFSQIDEVRSRVDPVAARDSLGLDPDRRVVLSLGIAEPRKGNAVLARAWAMISSEHPDAGLYMVGARDTPYCKAIRRYINAAGIADSCALEPPTIEPLSWHAAADIFALASDVESAPIALAEAMAFETPAVATRVFGVPELISDGLDGVLFEPNDVADLAATLDAVLRMDRDQLRAIGARGARRVREHHDPERFIERLGEVLEAIVAEREASPV